MKGYFGCNCPCAICSEDSDWKRYALYNVVNGLYYDDCDKGFTNLIDNATRFSKRHAEIIKYGRERNSGRPYIELREGLICDSDGLYGKFLELWGTLRRDIDASNTVRLVTLYVNYLRYDYNIPLTFLTKHSRFEDNKAYPCIICCENSYYMQVCKGKVLRAYMHDSNGVSRQVFILYSLIPKLNRMNGKDLKFLDKYFIG